MLKANAGALETGNQCGQGEPAADDARMRRMPVQCRYHPACIGAEIANWAMNSPEKCVIECVRYVAVNSPWRLEDFGVRAVAYIEINIKVFGFRPRRGHSSCRSCQAHELAMSSACGTQGFWCGRMWEGSGHHLIVVDSAL